MKAGKLAAERLERLVLSRLGLRRPEVLVRAAIGQDSAVIDGGDRLWVTSSDPITGTSAEIGWLAVHISCNDVACNGADPLGVQVVLLLPESAGDEDIAAIMAQVDQAARELGIEVLGGHTEVTSKVSDPIVVTTAMGLADRSQLITSAGARPGNAVWITKGVGLEGTAILAWEAAARLAGQVGPDVIEAARALSRKISVVPDARCARSVGATALHDVTEGGLYGALWELSRAAGVGFAIDREAVPVLPETAAICSALEIDPCGLISSGTLLITAPAEAPVGEAMARAGIPCARIGWVTASGTMELRQGGERRPLPQLPEDELWRYLAS